MRSTGLRTTAVRFAAAVLMIVGFVVFVAYDSQAASYGDTGAEVTQVQEALAEFGYTVATDGQFGPRTLKAVKHFQLVSGLLPDGIVGPKTSAALDIGSAPATPPPPVQTFSGPCAQYAPVLAFFDPGWDVATMQSIMNRESRCRPDVTSSTGCCHGLLQIHQMHIRNLGACDVDSVQDLFDPGKNICSAAILFRRAGGMSPWNL